MKLSELRIGNLLHHNSEWCYRGEGVGVFKWGESDWYALGECTMFIENIEPISLTEDWLEEFGFEWSIPHQAYHKENFDYVCDFYETYPNIDGCLVFLNKHNRNGDKLIEIKFVHQLQNLYNALTGEELILKTK